MLSNETSFRDELYEKSERLKILHAAAQARCSLCVKVVLAALIVCFGFKLGSSRHSPILEDLRPE